jgi:hypothetical protein
MQITRAQHFIRWALAAVFLVTSAATAVAGSFTRGCAARDMQILMMIEDQESASAVSEAKLRDALFAMMDARFVCHEGQVFDALAIYDGIARSICPIRFGPAECDQGKSNR